MNTTYFTGKVEEKEAVELLGNLISINSVNPLQDTSAKGEKEVAACVKNYLDEAGIKSFLQPVLNERPNVIGVLEGEEESKNFVLEAHMDTVKVDNMRIDPFSPKVEGGKMFGRGACDAKGSLASMLLAMNLLRREDVPLKSDVFFAATVDEEHRYRGVSHLLNQEFRFNAGIVGEPTGLDVLVAHRGCLRWRITTRGVAAHSSEPKRGKNAIYFMSEVIEGIKKKLIPLCEEKSHPLVGSPSLSVNIIKGGTQINIVPDECFIEMDRRLIPGENSTSILQEIDTFLKEIERKNPSLKVQREAPFINSPPMEINKNEEVVEALFNSVKNIAGAGHSIRGGRFDSDAGKFVARGIPTPVFGPGNIAQAHSENEWVSINEVVEAAQTIARSIALYQKVEL